MSRFLRRLLSSVRVRVTLTALVAVACALVVSSVLVDAGMQHYRQRTLMATAQEQARLVLALNPELTTPLVLPSRASIDTGLVQVLRDGRVLGSSRPLHQVPPLWEPGQPQVSSPSQDIPDLARDVRTVAVPVGTGKARSVVVVVISLQQYDRSVAYVRRLLAIGTPMLVGVVGVISWLIVGRALRPIEMMRREVADVATVHGGHRVAEPSVDDEVARLARTLNSMLDRIQASSERERRFVSDASHELRSPIANIRTELEVALHHPGAAAWPDVAGEVLAQNERMEQLVAGLLLLARSDEGSLPTEVHPVDMAEVVGRLAGSGPGPAAGAPGRPAVTVPVVKLRSTPAPVSVPVVYLERMASNLLDNARRFASSVVTVTVGAEEGAAVLRVADDGPGIAAKDRGRVFERFVRLDEARDRGDGGFGLGLAIVADLSRFYGGSIEVRPADSGAVFVLRLPLATTHPALPEAAPGQAVRIPAT